MMTSPSNKRCIVLVSLAYIYIGYTSGCGEVTIYSLRAWQRVPIFTLGRVDDMAVHDRKMVFELPI